MARCGGRSKVRGWPQLSTVTGKPEAPALAAVNASNAARVNFFTSTPDSLHRKAIDWALPSVVWPGVSGAEEGHPTRVTPWAKRQNRSQ
ncbi:hypothetical protein D3C76_1354820 [compost metagenome]